MSMLPRLRPRNPSTISSLRSRSSGRDPSRARWFTPTFDAATARSPSTYPNDEPCGKRARAERSACRSFRSRRWRSPIVAAGFTPGEADQLASGDRRLEDEKGNAIAEFRPERLVRGMDDRTRLLTGSFAGRCFRADSRGSASYGFPESHAASFALIVYVSVMAQEVIYPAEFAAALINSQPMGFYAPAQIVRDAAGAWCRGAQRSTSNHSHLGLHTGST